MSAEIQLEHRRPVRRLFRRVMSALDRGLDWCEVHGSWATDGLNPILVKETRQALKSRQFVVSFLVVLGACWIATIGGVAVIGPEIYWGAAGREMLVAYFCILAAPLVIVVPYSAYRSLAVEREENTYDLLSITTLGARQIITGKLLSAAAQMLVYFSAVAPCIAFTFLLRGVDAITVGMLLGLLVFVCLGLSMIALVTGTLSQAKYSQVIVSVGLVLGLVPVFSGVVALAYAMIESGAQLYGEEEFWLTLLLLATTYVVIFGLLHAAAEARITFSSENRSTRIRKWMIAVQGCMVAWLVGIVEYVVFERNQQSMGVSLANCIEPVLAFGATSLAFWYLMGTLTTSEWPHLSRRVQRSLPASRAGRIFGSWFNPGPGTGLVFALANYGCVALACFVFVLVCGATGNRYYDSAFFFFPLSWAYLAAYLAAGRLVMNLARRFAFVPLAAGFLIHMLLLLAGVGGPMVVFAMSPASRYTGAYSMWQVSNPAMTLSTLLGDGSAAIDAPLIMLLVGGAAVVLLLLNVPSIATELHRQRIPIPVRLVEDEADLAAAVAKRPQSPWDEDALSGGR